MKLKPNDFRKIVVGSFLAVPALSSLISTIHIVTFFGLGNMPWMAIILALAFEIGSIASLMTLAVLDKVNRFAVWFIFFVLVVMQMLGNVYYTYDFISNSMLSNPQWINSFIDLVEMMTMQKLDPRMSKFILSLLIGLPIPVISLAFLKSVSDYLKPEEKTEIIESSVKEEPKEESKEEIVEDAQNYSEIEKEEELSSEEKAEPIIEDELPNTPFIRVNQIIIPQKKAVIEEEPSIQEMVEIASDVENESQIIEEAQISEPIEEENVADVEVAEEYSEIEEIKEEAKLEEESSIEEVLEQEESIETEKTEDIYESEIISTEERIIQDIIEEKEGEVEESNSENEQDEKKN